MSNPATAAAIEKIEELRQGFAEQLDVKVEALSSRWSSTGGSLDDAEHVQAMELSAHNLAGAGATLGYPEVSECARTLENIFSRALDPDATQQGNSAGRIDELIGRLREAARKRPEPLELVGRSRDTRLRHESEPKLIFVVDDDEAQAQVLAEEIRHYGCETTVFTSPNEMYAALPHRRPHLVLMDIVFPEGSSHRLERSLSLTEFDGWNLPVIFMSSREDFDARLEAVRAGASGYFVKPVDSIKLVERVNQLTTSLEPEPYRVLIVEDDETLAQTYAVALHAAGMSVETISDPRQLSRQLSEFDVELILMDINLPKCSGLDLAKVIRQQDIYTSVPIVFLSTEGRLDRQLFAMSLGGDDFLTKPVRPNHLVAAVSSRVQRARVMRSFMVRDSMTGALNHANILEQLKSEVARAQRSGTQFCFCILDLDHFKSVNDTYGHPTGDRVIKSVAQLLQRRLRKTDVIGRYGGEEFAVILPETEPARAYTVIDSLRDRFSALRQSDSARRFSVTLSGGIAAYPRYATASELTEAADDALYRAKADGRNRVVLTD